MTISLLQRALALALLVALASCTSMTPGRAVARGAGTSPAGDRIQFTHSWGIDDTEPLFSIRISPDWRERPRRPIPGTDRWTLETLESVTPLNSSEQVVYRSDRAVRVIEELSPPMLSYAHGMHAEGTHVFFVEQSQGSSLSRAEIFGAIDWPIQWVRVAEVEWTTPAEREVVDPGMTRFLILLQAAGALSELSNLSGGSGGGR